MLIYIHNNTKQIYINIEKMYYQNYCLKIICKMVDLLKIVYDKYFSINY